MEWSLEKIWDGFLGFLTWLGGLAICSLFVAALFFTLLGLVCNIPQSYPAAFITTFALLGAYIYAVLTLSPAEKFERQKPKPKPKTPSFVDSHVERDLPRWILAPESECSDFFFDKTTARSLPVDSSLFERKIHVGTTRTVPINPGSRKPRLSNEELVEARKANAEAGEKLLNDMLNDYYSTQNRAKVFADFGRTFVAATAKAAGNDEVKESAAAAGSEEEDIDESAAHVSNEGVEDLNLTPIKQEEREDEDDGEITNEIANQIVFEETSFPQMTGSISEVIEPVLEKRMEEKMDEQTSDEEMPDAPPLTGGAEIEDHASQDVEMSEFIPELEGEPMTEQVTQDVEMTGMVPGDEAEQTHVNTASAYRLIETKNYYGAGDLSLNDENSMEDVFFTDVSQDEIEMLSGLLANLVLRQKTWGVACLDNSWDFIDAMFGSGPRQCAWRVDYGLP